jgi:hypothetical protein
MNFNDTIQQFKAPPVMTDAYHKARRSYGLFSGLLIAWELIGVEVKEAPFQNYNILLKSPNATPYVLIILVAYFAFRLSIEWYHCHPARRTLKQSRIDLLVAHSIGFISIALYAIQRILDLQLADKFMIFSDYPWGWMFAFSFLISNIPRAYNHYKAIGGKIRFVK